MQQEFAYHLQKLGAPTFALFASLCSAAQEPFMKAVSLPLKQKFLNTAYHLCVCEDRNLNIVSKMIGTVCQAFPNSEQNSF